MPRIQRAANRHCGAKVAITHWAARRIIEEIESHGLGAGWSGIRLIEKIETARRTAACGRLRW